MKYFGVFVMGICLALSACSETKKLAPKDGRIAIIHQEKIAKSQEKIHLEKPIQITEWTGPYTNNRNKIPHVLFDNAFTIWKAKGATGRSKNDLPMLSPVIIGEKIYTLDSESTLIARQTKDGQKLWQVDSQTLQQGVGLVANQKTLITVTENGTVTALDLDGKEVWKKELKTSFRNAPLLAEGTLYLLSVSNEVWALNTKTGAEKWHYQTSASQTLLQGMGRPALEDNVLVIPFSNGEVVGFDAQNGVLLWSQDLIGQKTFDAIANLAQMSASPVIEKGIVYLLGHGGKTMAVNLKTGESLWQLDLGGKNTPLISGNALFFIDNQNHFIAINKKSGKLFWEIPLKNKLWKGPYLIEEKLILFSEDEKAFVTPKDGKVTYQEGGIEGSLPALTQKGIFFLNENGHLHHWEKI